MSLANRPRRRVGGSEAEGLRPAVYEVPAELDAEVARLKLHAMGIEIDTLTPQQEEYLHSWKQGT